MVFLYENQHQMKYMICLIFVFTLLGSKGVYNTFLQWKDLETFHVRALALNENLLEDKKTTPYGAYILDFTHYGVLPSKLFSYKSYNGQFLSMGHFENLPLFKEKKRNVLGKDFDKLPAKFDFLIKNNLAIYSNKEVLQFQQSYLEVVHRYRFEIVEVKEYKSLEFPNLSIKKFRLVQN